MSVLHTDHGVEGSTCVGTDDMLHVGIRTHHLKMNQLKSMYSFGKWEKERGMFCGKWVALQPGGGLTVHPAHYVEQKVHLVC